MLWGLHALFVAGVGRNGMVLACNMCTTASAVGKGA